MLEIALGIFLAAVGVTTWALLKHSGDKAWREMDDAMNKMEDELKKNGKDDLDL
jgi:hypothetical protein